MIKILVLWFVELLWCLSDFLMRPRMIAYEKGFQREVKCKKFDPEIYYNKVKQNFRIKSDYGYPLYCELIEADNNQDMKIAILCHGLGYASYGSIKYVDFFLKLGYSVLLYDHRNHGKSGKALTSMGFYEKYDLNRVVDWCYDHYGNDCKIITHGESMGAATVLLNLGIDDRVKCAIADCSYSDLSQLLCHQLKQYYHLPCFFIPVESFITYLRAGYWFHQVSPIEVVSKTDTPILFIHGKRDNFVPTHMTKQLYQVKKTNKAIYLVAKAKHTESYCTNTQGYEKKVEEFLNRYIK